MNAERVIEVVRVLRHELDENPVLQPLDEIAKILRARDLDGAKARLQSLDRLLFRAPSNRFSPSRYLILRAIGGAKLVGNGLATRLDALLNDYRLDPAEMSPIVAQVHHELHNFQGLLNN